MTIQWKNNTTHFGLIAIVLHWLVAFTVFGIFGLGLWMTGLDYYNSWYKLAPWWHKSIGILLFLVVFSRFLWRLITPPPKVLPDHKPWEIKLAKLTHWLLYLLLFTIMLSGYLISTADNRPIDVFGLVSIPATITSIPNQEDVAGLVHKILAYSIIGLVLLHAVAALKHHFIDKDRTLKRIFGK